MKTKLSLFLGLSLLPGLSLPAANIAWVSFHPADDTPSVNAANAGFTNAPDAGYTALLRAHGHNVTRFVTVDNLDTAVLGDGVTPLLSALNTNDLVIISRSVPSGHYQQANETAAWNTSVTKPVMIVNGYVTRGGTGGGARLGLTTGETMTDVNVDPVRLRVNAPTHPIFAGVALDTNNVMVNPYARIVTFTNASTGATIVQRGISINNNSLITGGTLLAVVGTPGSAGLNGMVIAEFAAGLTASPGRDLLGGKRLVFLTGSREAASFTAEGAGVYDLLPDGETLFLNAVTYLTTAQAPKCTVPLVSGTNLVAGDAWTFTAGVIGDPPLNYQWYKNGQPMAGRTDAVLDFPSLEPADAGDYYLVVSNPSGSATSTVGRLEFAVFPPTSITNSLIAYWPLDVVQGNKTPDVVSGYDMTLVNMGATNVVAGRWGNAFQFDNTAQTLLERINNPGDDLPVNNHPNFTVSLWVNGMPYQPDRRVFSEGNLTNNTPLFNIGTHNGGSDGTVDIYIRSDSGATGGDHRHSVATAFDGSFWHNIVYVQRVVGEGLTRAQLWVDGVLDAVTISPQEPLTAMATSIGGIRRSAASAWFTGLIDEVAIWNRALSADEIQILQATAITNPPSRLQPLYINTFKADLPAVARGGSTTLRWDVSKDATQVTIDPLGDVTASTIVGIGAQTITVTQATTYVLTLHRGADSLSATTRVAVVDGIAPGWTLLDNFDTYPVGNLFANGYWNDVSGNSAQVLSVNNNHAARISTGGGIAFLNLRNLAVPEGQTRTLFFRIIAGADNAAGVTNIVGLTDKSQRGYGDAFFNIGPVLYPTPLTNDLYGIDTNAWYLGARNGWYGFNSSPPPDYPPVPLQPGTVYNVWLDITNAPLADHASDTFSVYIQKDGEAGRTLLFQDYTSDRDLDYVDAVLGGVSPLLDKLVIMGNSATYSAVFDDFYLSTSGYNATVPRPYGFTGQLPGTLSIRKVGSQVEIQWTSGTLQQATSLTGEWTDVPDNPTSPLLISPAGQAMFYRTR